MDLSGPLRKPLYMRACCLDIIIIIIIIIIINIIIIIIIIINDVTQPTHASV